MNLFNRLVVTLLAAALVLAGAFVFSASIGVLTPDALEQAPGLRPAVEWLQAIPGMNLLYASLGGIAAIFVGLALMIAEMRAPRKGADLLIRRDKLGTVSVSLTGLRRLADHVIGELPGVEAVATESRAGRDGVAFTCRVVVQPETHTQALVDEIRRRVDEAVKIHTGRPVTRIDVRAQVGGTEPNGRKRVR